MAQGPCLNPNCKSDGKPHPNCRCYMHAEGGSICDAQMPHDSHCEYYKDGGQINHHEDFGAAMHHVGLPKAHHGKSPEKHHRNMTAGHKKLTSDIDDLFATGYGKHPQHDPVARDKLDEEVKSGALHLPPSGDMGDIDPQQASMVGLARGRMAKYLGSLRPSPETAPRLAFDDPVEDPDKKRIYESALHVANEPSSILGHIKAGTLEPEHLSHLGGMYPETAGLYQKRATDGIVKAQMEGRTPDAHVRAGLSKLVGAPLSSELTPASIQAAQAVFAAPVPQQAQGQGGGGNKPSGSKTALSKSSQAFLTGDQAREKREQKN